MSAASLPVVFDRPEWAEALEALRDVESDVQNGDETDPRVYVCTWQEQRLQDTLRRLANAIEAELVLGGTCPHSFILSLGVTNAPHDARYLCERCGGPGMDTKSGRIVPVHILAEKDAGSVPKPDPGPGHGP